MQTVEPEVPRENTNSKPLVYWNDILGKIQSSRLRFFILDAR